MNEFLHIILTYILQPNIIVLCFFVFLISFVITNRLIPVIIGTVQFKNLMDHPNERSSHLSKTPTLGGVAFFGSLMISLFFIEKYDVEGISPNLIVSLTILFFLGLKDDLMVLSSTTKIILQSAAIFFVIGIPSVLISNFHGFFGIYQVPVWFSICIGFLILIYVINAYNLVDGIDGLAALLGILISSIFTFLFFKIGLFQYSLLGISIIGFLVSFLRFNLSTKKKIFMGDTGSMIVGFLIGVLTLRFLALDIQQLEEINILPENVFIVALAILFFPVIDVIRVMLSRLIKRRGVFSPDRGHMHHIFIDKGLRHISASITMVISGLIVFIIIYTVNTLTSFIWLILMFIILSVMTFYLLLLLDKDEIARKHRKKIKKYIPKPIYSSEFRIRKKIILFLKKVFFKDLL